MLSSGAEEAAFAALYPFAGKYHAVAGGRLHYLDEGEGTPVVMLHGNPTWSFFYRDLVKALRGNRRCLAPDHLGMGFSDKPQDYDYTLAAHIANLESLLAAVAPEGEVDLVVHDWGGAIGLGWAARHPERVRRLVILNTAAFPFTKIPFRISICRLPGFGALALRGGNAFARCATFMTTRRPLPPEVKRGFLKPYGSWADRIGTLRFVQDIPMRPGHRSWETLREVEAGLAGLRGKPMLVQWGEMDWCFDLDFFAEWKRRFPEAVAESYADAGHYLLEDAGDRIIPRIGGFLS